MKKNTVFWVYGLLLLLMASVTAGIYSVAYLKWIEILYGAMMAAIFLDGAAMGALLAAAGSKPKKRVLLSALLGGGIVIGGVFVLSFVINILIYHERGAEEATVATAIFGFAAALFGTLRLKKLTGVKFVWKPLLGIVLCVCLMICGLIGLYPKAKDTICARSKHMEAVPSGLSVYTDKSIDPVREADLWVAPDGNDDNDGSFDRPLATLEKARELVRAMDKTDKDGITVALKAGEYRVGEQVFSEEDSGTPDCPVSWRACSDGEVILNGGMTLDPSLFHPVTDEAVLARLSENAKQNVICLSLHSLGVTSADYGKLYAIGTYNTARYYDGDYEGPMYCELFVNDVRCKLARYPDDDWLKTSEPLQIGRNVPGSITDGDFVSNPPGEIYRVDRELAERIHSWQTLNDVWMFGFFQTSWADGATPIGSFDYEERTLATQFVSEFGAVKDAPYYFFNVLEELDAPGEWYLDRESGTLYLYPPEDLAGAVIDLTLTTEPIITGKNVHDLTFLGFTVKGTRGDAICITGDRCTVSRCLIKNVGGSALSMSGYDNLASENEITHTGKAGITITGGDSATLTHGNSRADNNLIHDWSEIYYTYQPAVSLGGVGNICSHNEIYNCPHEAITYGGNDHIIEYNLIHDVCLLSDDAGAIYAGRSWTMYGNIVRYNAIYNLGTPGEHSPQGIYMDDALSGQTIYGNLLVNMPCYGLELGGGRDLIVQNNVLINTKGHAVHYDQRAIDYILNNGWFSHDTVLWEQLEASPWRSEIWQNGYPMMQGLHYNLDNTDDPLFFPNAAKGKVTGNLLVNQRNELGQIDENPAYYSDISGNAIYRLNAMKKLFVDPENGNYTLREDAPVFDEIPDFEPLPLSEIGRY